MTAVVNTLEEDRHAISEGLYVLFSGINPCLVYKNAADMEHNLIIEVGDFTETGIMIKVQVGPLRVKQQFDMPFMIVNEGEIPEDKKYGGTIFVTPITKAAGVIIFAFQILKRIHEETGVNITIANQYLFLENPQRNVFG